MADEKVSIDAISSAPKEPTKPETPEPGKDPLTGKDQKLDQHLGRVGQYIGGGPEKAGNIAYIVILAAFILLVVGGCFAAYAQSEKIAEVFRQIVGGSLTLISGALGFLFGKSGKSD